MRKGNEMGEHRTSNIQQRTSKSAAGERVFDLEDRLLEFASAVIDLTERLPSTRAGHHIAAQLLRSGTSPYSNHGEAESAESPDDFVHKLKVCLKELRETRRWLRLIERKEWMPEGKALIWARGEADELIRIFVASIRTARRNQVQDSPGNSAS